MTSSLMLRCFSSSPSSFDAVSAVVMMIIFLHASLCFAGDPTVPYDFRLSYVTASPLGVHQQVIAVNGKFPGPIINVTTNNHVQVNVWNDLDEGALLTW
ncbi:unnamed protein product [Rhodiola kirilowii]